jgi:hypothetical protein
VSGPRLKISRDLLIITRGILSHQISQEPGVIQAFDHELTM